MRSFGLLMNGAWFIPTVIDRNPFHRDYFATRQGAICAVVPALQANRNAALGQKNPASGGMKPVIGCVAALARCAGIALRTTPDRVDRFDAMKWVSIYEGWYYWSCSGRASAKPANAQT